MPLLETTILFDFYDESPFSIDNYEDTKLSKGYQSVLRSLQNREIDSKKVSGRSNNGVLTREERQRLE